MSCSEKRRNPKKDKKKEVIYLIYTQSLTSCNQGNSLSRNVLHSVFLQFFNKDEKVYGKFDQSLKIYTWVLPCSCVVVVVVVCCFTSTINI